MTLTNVLLGLIAFLISMTNLHLGRMAKQDKP